MRYLRASLVSGLVFCTLAPAVVHFVLPTDIVDGYREVFQQIERHGSAAAEAPANWLHLALVLALRLSFGFLAMAAFAFFRGRVGRWQAIASAGLTVFLITYAPLLTCFHLAFGLGLPCVAWGAGIGLVETQLAVFLGARAAMASPKATAG